MIMKTYLKLASNIIKNFQYCTYINAPKKIMFFGTDDFAVVNLDKLMALQSRLGLEKLCVVSIPEGKNPKAVHKYCKNNSISVTYWPLNIANDFDLGIVVSFGHLLPKELIESFPLGILNIHGSLLPRWRGSCPITHALLNGDKETGITVMQIRPEKFDIGKIIFQKSLIIPPRIKNLQLTHLMAKLGAECLEHSLLNLPQLLSSAKPQLTNGVTSAPKIKSEYSKILWETMEPFVIAKLFYAKSERHPLWTTWHGDLVKLLDFHDYLQIDDCHTPLPDYLTGKTMYKHLKILQQAQRPSLDIVKEKIKSAYKLKLNNDLTLPGKIYYKKKSKVIRIYCHKGYVEFCNIRIKGKPTLSALNFKDGYLSKVNEEDKFFY